MPVNIVRANENSTSLSWQEKQQLLQDTKNCETRSHALGILLQVYGRRIEIMCRSREWSRRWGFDDSYQEAIAYFCDLAIETYDPSELDSFWGLYSAIKNGAVRNLFPISLTPYYLKKLPPNKFGGDLEKVSDFEPEEQVFDELAWVRLKRLCQETLSKRQNKVLELVFRTPGFLPTTEEIAEYLGLAYSSAQRAWNYFRSAMQENLAIRTLWTELIGDVYEKPPTYGIDEADLEQLTVVEIETPLADVVSLQEFRETITQRRWRRTKMTFRSSSLPSEGIAPVIPIVSALSDADHSQSNKVAIEIAMESQECVPPVKNSAQRAMDQSQKVLNITTQVQKTPLAIASNTIHIKSCRGSPTDPISIVFLQVVS